MSLFKGQAHGAEKKHHVFVTNHPAMINAGMGSFNVNSISRVTNSSSAIQMVSDAFERAGYNILGGVAGQLSTVDPSDGGGSFSTFLDNLFNLLGFSGPVGSATLWGYTPYNKQNKKFDKDQATISSFALAQNIFWYEEVYLPDPVAYTDRNGHSATYEELYNKVDKITLSKEGHAVVSRAPDLNSIEKGLKEIYLKFYFADPNKLNPDRVVVPKGAPFFADIPRRSTGPAYSHSVSKGLSPGVYRDFNSEPDAYEPQDIIAAPLRVSYNSALGMYDSQNQIIGILLEDLPGVNTGNPKLNDQDLLAANSDGEYDVYDPTNKQYFGQFRTALVMPITSENGNPHVFGPNILDCDSNKIEKIIGVNRSSRSFTKGQRVLCHFVGNEWLVTELGDKVEEEPEQTAIGKWEFAKFITNVNTHFQLASQQGFTELPWNKGGNFSPWSPYEIQQLIVYQYWDSFGGNYPAMSSAAYDSLTTFGFSTIIGYDTLNLHPGIIQTSIFDQYDLGANYNNIAIAGNYPANSMLFFGPFFQGGHANRRTPDNATVTQQQSSFPGIVDVFGDDYAKFNMLAGKAGGDISELNRENMPAELAVNGPYTDNSSVLQSYKKIADVIDVGGRLGDTASRLDNLIATSGHWNYRYYTTPNNDERKSLSLIPINNGGVTFFSLTPQFAAADDRLATTDNLVSNYSNRAFRDHALEIVEDNSFNDVGPVAGLGAALNRGNEESIINFFAPNPILYGDGDNDRLAAVSNQVKKLRYDDTVYSVRTEAGLGINTQPDYWVSTDNDDTNPIDGSEVVGIITARNSITRTGGGVMNIQSQFQFGQGSNKLFRKTEASVDGIALFFGGGAGAIQMAETVQIGEIGRWGGRSNDIWDFGVTALHLKVYDWWPEEQTIFIAPYYTVLHFNPGRLGSGLSSKSIKTGIVSVTSDGTDLDNIVVDEDSEEGQKIKQGSYRTATVHLNTETDVDTRIPTDMLQKTNIVGNFYNKDSRIDKDGNTSDYWYDQLRESRHWNVSTKRRGMLLTGDNAYDDEGIPIGGAFVYSMSTLGLPGNTMPDILFLGEHQYITAAGTGFTQGDEYDIGDKGARIRITSTNFDGGITGFLFTEIKSDFIREAAALNGDSTIMQGRGYEAKDFPLNITVYPNDGVSDPAVIEFRYGEVYRYTDADYSPRLVYGGHNGRVLHPSTHKDGKQKTKGNQQNTISLPNNSWAKYPGRFECFYYFHNDMSHVGEKIDSSSGGQTDEVQYISINVT